jgi:hypothetical protein
VCSCWSQTNTLRLGLHAVTLAAAVKSSAGDLGGAPLRDVAQCPDLAI